ASTLERLSQIGYTTVETLNGGGDPKCYGLTAEEFKALCDKSSLTITSTHAAIQLDPTAEAATMDKWRALFASLREMGATYCVMPGYSFGQTLEEVKASCDYCNEVGALAKEYGLMLGYRNHAGDFVEVEGELLLDYVLAHTDEDKMFLQLDVHNMGGHDPMHYLTQYPDRVKLLHLKDDRELGRSGKIDFGKIMKQYRANGYNEIYVEYELPFRIGDDEAENERNLKELWTGLKACYDFVVEQGYAY
ncbi:MAG: TIM barrel protein, partial [Alistipes sp.]|nr:TIM barrel protein [Alistipes sp.]